MENNPGNLKELRKSLFYFVGSSITSNNETEVIDEKEEEAEDNSEDSDFVVLEESDTETQTTNRSSLYRNNSYEYNANAKFIINNPENVDGLQKSLSYSVRSNLASNNRTEVTDEKEEAEDNSEDSDFVVLEESKTKTQVSTIILKHSVSGNTIRNNEGHKKQMDSKDSSEISDLVFLENDSKSEAKAQKTKTTSFSNSSELLVFKDDHFAEEEKSKCSSNKERKQNPTLSDISKSSDEARRIQEKQSYTKHPHFHYLTSNEAEKYLKTKSQGDYIIRPSSKDANHLTITWIVTDNIYQNIDVKKDSKSEHFLLPICFWVNGMEYEDIVDVIAKNVTPMAAFALDLLNIKYYKDMEGALDREAEEFLKEEKEKHFMNTCVISASRDYPGKFFLSYFAHNQYNQESITVTKYGFRFRDYMFLSIRDLNEWLDVHFQHFSNLKTQTLEAAINGPFNSLVKELRLIQTYLRHALYPKFCNLSFIEAEKYMTHMNQGDFIIRPSSKGLTHIAITWKVTKKICQHVDIRKGNDCDNFSLWIGEEVYDDLDDVINRYIKPMAVYAQKLVHYENYRDIECNLQNTAQEILKEEKKDPEFSYIISATRDYPGKFLFSCIHKRSFHHDYITVTPYGIRYKHDMCGTIKVLDAYIRKSMGFEDIFL